MQQTALYSHSKATSVTTSSGSLPCQIQHLRLPMQQKSCKRHHVCYTIDLIRRYLSFYLERRGLSHQSMDSTLFKPCGSGVKPRQPFSTLGSEDFRSRV
jgi:hypothetical protein